MDVLRRDIAQVDLIDGGADLHIPRHTRRRDDELQRHVRIAVEEKLKMRAAGQLACRRVGQPDSVDLAHALVHFKQPRPARYAVLLERRRYGKAYRLFRPALVSDDQVRFQRLQPPVDTFDRSVEGFEVNGDVLLLFHVFFAPLFYVVTIIARLFEDCKRNLKKFDKGVMNKDPLSAAY